VLKLCDNTELEMDWMWSDDCDPDFYITYILTD